MEIPARLLVAFTERSGQAKTCLDYDGEPGGKAPGDRLPYLGVPQERAVGAGFVPGLQNHGVHHRSLGYLAAPLGQTWRSPPTTPAPEYIRMSSRRKRLAPFETR